MRKCEKEREIEKEGEGEDYVERGVTREKLMTYKDEDKKIEKTREKNKKVINFKSF